MPGGFVMLEPVRGIVHDLPGVAEVSSQRAGLLRSDPETYYITDHYTEHPWILVRPTVDLLELRERLIEAWTLVAPAKLVRQFESRE